MQVQDEIKENAYDTIDASDNQKLKTYDVIIIGSGPAGYTAGV